MDFWILTLLSFSGGILPAIIWLFFWLHHDDKHPEPNRLIILTFILGMAVVPLVLIFQIITNSMILGDLEVETAFRTHYWVALSAIVVWAAIEELFKYIGAYLGGLSQKENDEPIDPAIYLITAALGFSALENSLFLFGPIFQGETTAAILTGNMRFIGATLVHVASSAIIGIFIGLSYYKKDYFKQRYLIAGFILSIALHSVFNSFIIRGGNFTMVGFSLTWVVVIVVITFLEKLKHHEREPRKVLEEKLPEDLLDL